MPGSRSQKIVLWFGLFGGLLWGVVWLCRQAPLPDAIRIWTNAGPNIACALIAMCLFGYLVPFITKRPLTRRGYACVLTLVFFLGVGSELFYWLILGHGFDAVDLLATCLTLALEGWLLFRFG